MLLRPLFTPLARAGRHALVLALLCLCALPMFSAAEAAEPCASSSSCAAASDLWLISTRGLCGGCGDLQVEHYCCDGGWQQSTLEEYLAAAEDPALVNSIFVHGNDYEAWLARQEGMRFYHALTRSSCCRQPVRFVIWSWPSSRVARRIRDDVLIKARRTNTEAVHLAEVVKQLPSAVPQSLIGYSYGARVVTGALHLTGGGKLFGRTIDDPTPDERPPTHVVLLAAATDSSWLRPGSVHGEALTQADRLTNFVNQDDFVLRLYPRFVSSNGMAAMGGGGITLSWLGDLRNRVMQIGVTSQVGRQHSLERYMYNGGIISRIRNEALFQEPASAAARPGEPEA